MWFHQECCCSFLSATKATCFYFLRLGPCSFELWRNTVRYVTYEMKGMNANQQNTTQSICASPALEDRTRCSLFVRRNLHSLWLFQPFVNNRFHVSSFSTVCPFHHDGGILSAEVIPGSVTLIQVQIDIKGPPNIKFAFISLCRGSASSAPSDSPQDPARFQQGPSAGFLTSVHVTFLCRHETTLGKYLAGPKGFWLWGNRVCQAAKRLSALINPICVIIRDHRQRFQIKSKENKWSLNVIFLQRC